MSRPLLIILGIIGAGLLVLIVNHDAGTSLGMENDSFASLLYLGAWGLVLSAAIFGGGMRLAHVARDLVLWLFIILALVAGYQYRYELQDIGNRMSAGLIPASPLSSVGADGAVAVMVSKANSGHFEVTAEVNGADVLMLFDTGASAVVLTADDARRAGIDVEALSFSIPVSTANGTAQAASVTIDDFAVGDINRVRLRAMVAQPGRLDTSLMGMSFLGTLTGYDIRGDRLILHD